MFCYESGSKLPHSRFVYAPLFGISVYTYALIKQSKETSMIRRNIFAVILLLLASLGGFSMAGAAESQASKDTSGTCDRECLRGFITQYLDAMIAHKPESLSVAANVKYTEDCVEMKLGEGLWKDISRLRSYRLDILDVREGNAFTYVVAEVGNSPVLYAVRLKIAGMKITEIETMAVRNQQEGMIFRPEALQTASKAMTEMPDRAQLNSREEAIKIAVHYPEGLKIGSFVKVDAPFASDAYRFENGQLMAGKGCTFFQGCENIKTQMIPPLSKIIYKVALVDEEQGVVLLRMNFGPGSTFGGNTELDVWEAFKIYGGQIHAVEAYMQTVPIGTKSGW
jgi:hypothetical protein